MINTKKSQNDLYSPAQTKEQEEQRREKREILKRPLDVTNGSRDKLLSKNKIKKLQRNPEKNFNPKDKVVYEKCRDCGNPKVHIVYFNLCLACL